MIFLRKIIRLFTKTLSCVYSINTSHKYQMLKRVIYSEWLANFFSESGEHLECFPPIVLKNPRYVKLGRNVSLGTRSLMCAHPTAEIPIPSIVIGDNCIIGDDCNIQCSGMIKLGNNVLMGRKTMLNNTSHGSIDRKLLDMPPTKRPLLSSGNIVIEDNVWIGEMVCILGGVHIGKGAVIGAGSVVTHDILPYCVAVGAPAKIIKDLSENE